MKVTARQLRFPLDSRWNRKSGFLERLIARHAAKRILNSECSHFQFGGYTGAKMLKYEFVDAEKEALAHWILRDCGYSCCTNDLMKLTGSDANL